MQTMSEAYSLWMCCFKESIRIHGFWRCCMQKLFQALGNSFCTVNAEMLILETFLQIPDDISNGTFVTNGIGDVPTAVENRIGDDKFSTERLLQLTKAISVNNVASALEQLKRENSTLKTGESSKHIPNLSQQCSSSAFAKTDNSRQKHGVKDTHESLTHPSLNFSLTTPLCSSNTVPPFLGRVVEGSEHNKGSFQHAQKTRNNLPKLPKPSPTAETNKGHVLQSRVARPPAEGRGRNQLLPRYWPRITDQELQQLSGDLKSTIVPLFEKILSASDAGRIGRLVLPKACAEAYFPTINQSEGIQIKIQDIKGKEWTFQFRFWPNNNSRMYVLEGVTPCIQSMQLQAGDTVIFSRIDPGGQLVIGCRKASNVDVQDTPTTTAPNGDSPREALYSGVTDKLSNAGRAPDDSMQQHMTISEKKKTRNIKNQRPFMHNDDAVELRITWEEAQELFRPSPSAEPTVVVVEGREFEEFEEPPIFGKRTIFISQSLGEQEQLAQCDRCSKWRRLPANALLSSNWTCFDNVWDLKRHSCSAPEEINPRDLDFFSMNNDSKKRRVSESKPSREGEPSGLDALANAAVLGDNVGDLVESSVGATTRHPRHRPGCTCIVCIQPPSGKGKHDPACKCNVCSTVRRRFKTLMMRKKKRQSEREAELAQEKDNNSSVAKIELEREGIAGHALLNMSHPESGTNHNGSHAGLDDMNKGQLDLNCDPHREDDILAEAAGVSLTDLVNAATLPLDVYPGQNGTPNLEPCLFSRTSAAAASEENATDEGGLTAGHVDGKDG